MDTNKISESEFAKICEDIYADRKVIFKHNPIGTMEETLLWMLMSVLISYLSLEEGEAPCFTGKPTADTYREAVLYLLVNRKKEKFNPEKYIERLYVV